MDPTPEEIATAFSTHLFAETYPYLLDDVRWNLVGDQQVTGREAVMRICESTAEGLSDVTTRFVTLRTVVGEDGVVVASEAEYVGESGETSTVASCDLFDFSNGRVARITSYTVELSRPAE